MQLSKQRASAAPARGQCATAGPSGRVPAAPSALRPLRPATLVRASPSEGDTGSSGSGSGGAALSEDMIARLRASEEETERLRRELARVQQQQQTQASAQQGGAALDDGKPQRIDGTDSRETPWNAGGNRRNSWLSEEDVDFLTGGGPSEAASSSGPTPEQQAAIQRRVLFGGAAAAGLLAFAFVPTKALRPRPPQPLEYYLASLIRARAQLAQLRGAVDDADWDTLRLVLPRIVGPPGDAKAALYDAIALLDDRSVIARAEDIAADAVDALANIDAPRKYFDAMPTVKISGAQNAEFVRFAGSALKRADGRIADFLALMPREALEAARRATAAEAAAGGDDE